MIEIERALALCAEHVSALPAEPLPLAEVLDRVLAEPARARLDLPPFPQSSMDGYALAAASAASAGADSPVRLPLRGEVAAGRHREQPRLTPGTVTRIFTGAVIPEGADAVVKQEDVRAYAQEVELTAAVAEGNNIRRRGEELAAGAQLAATGERITPGMVGALAAAGVDEIAVRREPRIAVLVTGNEVSAAGTDLALGAVYDANGPLLHSLLEAWGYRELSLSYVEDEWDAVEQALSDALEEADVVVTTGGVSVGDKDLVIPVAKELGVREVFWRVRQKPGKPLFFGVGHADTPILGLPGNPAAVLVGAHLYLRRILDCLEGANSPGPVFRRGRLAEETRADTRRDCWLRARWWTASDGSVELAVLDHQASHMLSNLCAADAVVRLPASAEAYPAGSRVEWLPL